jgi:predicted DCC family thiol-disulfide oxidoreductase YuxK
MERPLKAVLVYDGECAFCRNSIDWIRARMDRDAFEFLSCHSDDLAKRFPSIGKEACLQAMHLVLPDGSVLIGERAIPEILRHLRGYRWTAAIFRLPGAGFLSRVFYRWFAKNRHHCDRIVTPAT